MQAGGGVGPDEPTSDADDTVALSRDELVPPPPSPDPVDASARWRDDPGSPERRGRGLVWIAVVVALTAAFVVACYLIVARAEDDRSPGPPPSTTQPPTTTGSTTTSTAPPPVTRAPAEVTVAVLNGTEQEGWAGDNAARLDEAGYPTETTDAIGTPETTTIYVAGEDLRPDGAAVAAAIGLPDAAVELRPAEPLSESAIDQDVSVVVVLGADSLGG